MDLRAYARIARARWRLILLVTLLCTGASSLYVFKSTPTYEASVQLFVSTQGGDSASDLQLGNTFTQSRVASYAKVASSQLVLQPVIDRLGLQEDVESLQKQVSASAPLNTVLINLSVNDTNRLQASRIANAVAGQLTVVVAGLEQPTSGGSAPVRVTVTQPATVPTSPVSPKVHLDLALGFLVGLALGIGCSVLRDALDITIRTDDDIKSLTDIPVIGGIVMDPDAATRPLVVQSDPQGVRAEAFRQLRTNLLFLNVSNRPRSIVVTSSIPGEGKSTTTANLALTLAAAGSTVALVEADLRRPRVGQYLGLDNGAGLTSVLIGEASVDAVLQPWGNGKLKVIASGPKPPNPSELLGSSAMEMLLGELTSRFDFVLIDAPPILPFTDAAILSKVAGGTVLLVGAGKATRDQLVRSIDSLAAVNANVVGVISNFLSARGAHSYGYRYGYQYSGASGEDPAGAGTGTLRMKGAEPDSSWESLTDAKGRWLSTVRRPSTERDLQTSAVDSDGQGSADFQAPVPGG